MSYNYSEFKKKKKDNFKPSMPPPDNPVPSGMIKDKPGQVQRQKLFTNVL